MRAFPPSFVLIIVLELTSRSGAHPGAIAEGRGSCGDEFDTAQTAFQIPDIKEAWFVRRVGTCSHPFFWITFDTTVADQKVTFVAGSPDRPEFEDKLNFNAVIFGPGYPSVATPRALSDWEVMVPSGLGGKVLSSPSSFESCDFVSNPVMTQYKKVTGGRCMEHMTIAADYKAEGLAGATWNNYWLANHDLKIPAPGTHYLVAWASHRTTNKVSSGRIEITTGPWTWSSYASDSTKAQAQSQTTTCSCAINHASWYGQNLNFLGNPSADLFPAQLPFQECSAPGVKSTSSCRAGTKSPTIKWTGIVNDSSVEWAGLFDLEAGAYDWDFFAFKFYEEWKFPDSTMDVVVVKTTGTTILVADETAGDKAMTAALADKPEPSLVAPSGEMTVDSDEPVAFRISLPTPGSTKVTFKLVVPAKGSYVFFTQHRPSEFLSEQLTCTTACPTGSKYAFWKASKTYGVSPNKATALVVTKAQATLSGPGVSAAPRTVFSAAVVLIFLSVSR